MARRRFQRGSVFQNKSRTMWLGQYAEYVLDSGGVEKRVRRQVVLGPVQKDGRQMTKREAQRLLQPFVDRVNSSISAPDKEHKSAAFDAFAQIWERDYLSLSKASTQATMRGQLKRLRAVLGSKDIRHIGAGDLQHIIAAMNAEGKEPKTIRNLWVTVRLIWGAAHTQGYVDRMLPRPKLPRIARKKPRYFRLGDVAQIIAHSQGEHRTFYWLAAETGCRAGELCALRLADINAQSVTVNQSVWQGRVQPNPKTDNSVRTLAVSAQLAGILSGQIERQRAKGHNFLFSVRTGRPWDQGRLLKRKLRPLLRSLGIPGAGLHGFRHFNASLLGSLRVPLKTIQDRLGHASAGSLTLDVYTHSNWKENAEAAQLAGEAIEKAVNSVSLTAIKQQGLPASESEAPVAV